MMRDPGYSSCLWIFCVLSFLERSCFAGDVYNMSSISDASFVVRLLGNGTTGLIIGQDLYSISNYTEALARERTRIQQSSGAMPHSNTPLPPSPFGVMSYTSLQTLQGLEHPTDYGSGTQWVRGLLSHFPASNIQLGLWLVDQCEKITLGQLDTNIRDLATFMKRFGGNRTSKYSEWNSELARATIFFVRVGYEFDFQSNHYPKDHFLRAFRRIVRILRQMSVRNVVFVWHASEYPIVLDDHGRVAHPNNTDAYKKHYQSWYPGPEYVDMCGISMFKAPYDTSSTEDFQMPAADNFAQFCRDSIRKPLIIAESTPFGGIIDKPSSNENGSFISVNSTQLEVNMAGYAGDSWMRWFEPVLAFINRYDVRIWSYINCDWDSQPQWAREHQWGDTRVEAHKTIFNRWIDTVIDSDPRTRGHNRTFSPPSTINATLLYNSNNNNSSSNLSCGNISTANSSSSSSGMNMSASSGCVDHTGRGGSTVAVDVSVNNIGTSTTTEHAPQQQRRFLVVPLSVAPAPPVPLITPSLPAGSSKSTEEQQQERGKFNFLDSLAALVSSIVHILFVVFSYVLIVFVVGVTVFGINWIYSYHNSGTNIPIVGSFLQYLGEKCGLWDSSYFYTRINSSEEEILLL